ncbi:phage tail sheath family protein [Enterobacteriaceae bacterium LUAb1]
MAMVLPRVSYHETQLMPVPKDDPVTMPLFIGYSLPVNNAATPVAAMQLVSVESLMQAEALFGQQGTLAYSLRHFFDNDGLHCYVLSPGVWEGTPAARLLALIKALQSPLLADIILADTQTGLLLVPEMSELNDIHPADFWAASKGKAAGNPDTLWYQGWKALLALCQQGRQRFALLELPEDPVKARALARRAFSAEHCQHAAAWWPRLQTCYDDLPQTARVLSPLPAVAAAIQCSAVQQGAWKAPANIALAKTHRPTHNSLAIPMLSDPHSISFNLIRSFVGKGVRLWGCRTLLNDETSAWRYIQTRLLVNSVERHITQLARAYLFEPNTAQTWMKLKGQVWAWLRQKWLEGAFFGTVEEDAFSFSIGLNETMSEEDIRNGKMILRLRLALLAPAEFIDLSLTLDLRNGSAGTQTGGKL